MHIFMFQNELVPLTSHGCYTRKVILKGNYPAARSCALKNVFALFCSLSRHW